MPSNSPWARYDPRIRLTIGDKELPCIRCSVDYELNAIPQASAQLAVGRGFDGKASPTHALAANFVDRAPAQIYITPNAQGQSKSSAMQSGDLGLAGTEVMIFDGFVTAAGFTRSRGAAQFTVQMEHWLSELGFSSIFSKTSHPANPGHYAFGALSPTDNTGAIFSLLGLAYKFATSTNVNKDLWGLTVKPFFQFLCKQDSFVSYDPYLKGYGGNDAALAALNRFNSPHQQKLALAIASDADVASNIAEQIGAACGDAGALANQTMWDVLTGMFAFEYLFKIVPRVKDAIVAPFVPGYRTAYTTITANEETQVEWMRGLGRPLRGVGIMANAQSTTGARKSGEGADPQLGIGGSFIPDKNAKNGMIVIKTGPDWVTKLFAPGLYSGVSTGGTGKAISTAVTPGGPAVNNVTNDMATRLKTTIRPFLDKYAQAHYALEKLGQRQAVCSCPFRLDIAPGSTVMVQNEGEQYIANDPLATPFYGHVVRVSLGVDGEQPMIGTSFHLSHIRSEKENGDDRTSVAKHPLYANTFSGCGLIDVND